MGESSRLRLARKTIGFTQAKVAEALEIGQNAYSMIENDRVRLTSKNRNILAEKLKINPVWLETGIGEMFLDPTKATLRDTLPPQNSGVPYYEKPLHGPKILSLSELALQNPEYLIDFAPFNDCSLYRPVYGESMSPKYNPNDILACKKIINTDNIQYGETYLCVINNSGDFYETVKILRAHQEDKSLVILRPINPNFDETIVPIESISELYIIKGKIERNL